MAASPTCREIGDYVIDKDDGNCLGRTQKASVYPGKHTEIKGLNIAAKMFLWDKRYSANTVNEEIALMKSIPPHENVLKIFHHDTVEVGKFKELWLILEHCQLGHLGEFAYRESLSLAQKVDLMLQASRGIHHLHHLAPPVIHRDIKPANLLVSGTPGQPVLKVADFGESRYFHASHEDSVRNITVGGTPYYQAPELFTGEVTPEQNKAVDIFALGMSFQDLLEAQMGVDSTPMKGN
jgi:serine/threonine protein kinase